MAADMKRAATHTTTTSLPTRGWLPSTAAAQDERI